jgi:outer membrane protein assembly factor BamB
VPIAIGIAVVPIAFAIAAAEPAKEPWSSFRGPNARGFVEAGALPSEIGPQQNLVWRTELPVGYSSPVVGAGCVYVTGHEAGKLYTICLDRGTGAVRWRQEAPRPRSTERPVNTPASATPAADGSRVFVLFEDFGLLAYDASGRELWRRPLGPFNLPYGIGTSPIVADGKVVLLADQDTGSYLAAFDVADGRELWRTERPEAQHGFSTPVVYRPAGGEPQLVVLGSYELAGYALATGEKRWWVRGMAWQSKSTPVLDGDVAYVNSSMPTMSELDEREKLPPFADVLKAHDADGDGRIAKSETPVEAMKKLWFLYDLEKDGVLDEREWRVALSRDSARSGLHAVTLGGRGDLGEAPVRWTQEKSIPNIPTPLLYRGVLYVLKEGGILTTIDPATGKLLKQGRLEGAVDPYYASPIAADGKVFFASQTGKVSVVKAGAEWEILKLNDLGEEIWATPGLDERRLLVRTQKALYCFASKGA